MQATTARRGRPDGRSACSLGHPFDFPFDGQDRRRRRRRPVARGRCSRSAIYDTLTPGRPDRRQRRSPAPAPSTGDGTVGPIGGIPQKLVGARDGGAHVVPGPGRQLRRGRRPRARTGCGSCKISTFARGPARRRGDRRRQGSALPTCTARAAARQRARRRPLRCGRRLSPRGSRAGRGPGPGAMSWPDGDLVVAVVLALAQQADRSPSRSTATSSRTSCRSGCAARASTAASGSLRQVPLGLRRHDDRSTARAAPSTSAGQASAPEQRLERRGRRQALLLDRGQVRPSARRRPQLGRAACGSLRDQAGGADEGEQPRRLVPADARDVPLGLQGGGHGRRADDRLRLALGHAATCCRTVAGPAREPQAALGKLAHTEAASGRRPADRASQ